MSRSNKAMALFGMQSKSTIEGITRSGLAHWGDFVIPVADYHMFWNDMQRSENTTMFATKLLLRLVEIISAPDKACKKIESVSPPGTPQDAGSLHHPYTISICHTLHFLLFFFTIDKSNREFSDALQTLKKNQYMRETRIVETITAVHQALQQDSMDEEAKVRKIVLDCSWFGRANQDFAFEWLFLKKSISQGKCVEKSIKEIVILLNNLSKMLKALLVFPDGTKFESTLESLVALQHMLQQILSFHPIQDINYLLHEALPALRPLCVCACPLGQVACETITIIQNEILSPGAAARIRMHEEVPMVNPVNLAIFNDLLLLGNPGITSRRLELWGQCQRCVFVYARGDDPLAINLAEVLQGLGGEYDMEWCVKIFDGGIWRRQVGYLRAMLVLSSIENDIEIDRIKDFPMDVEQFLDMETISDDQLCDWYARINVILQDSKRCGAESHWTPAIARQFRCSHLAPIVFEIMEHCNPGARPPIILPLQCVAKKTSSMPTVLKAASKFRSLGGGGGHQAGAGAPREPQDRGKGGAVNNRKGKDKSSPPPPPPPPTPPSQAGKTGAPHLSGFDRQFVPGLPPLEVEYDNMYLNPLDDPGDLSSVQRRAADGAGGGGAGAGGSSGCDVVGESRYLRYPDAQAKGTWNVRTNGTTFPYKAYCKDGVCPPSFMNVCVLGGDAALHRVLSNYVVTRLESGTDGATSTDAQPLLKTRIFLVPTARGSAGVRGGQLGDLASFIARHDLWYRRQVYSQFTSLALGSAPVTVLPHLRQEVDYRGRDQALSVSPVKTGKSGKRQTDVSGPPLSYMGQLMRDYVRSARHEFKVQVFDCECWTTEARANGVRQADSMSSSSSSGSGFRSGSRRVSESKAYDDVGAADTPCVATIPFCVKAELGLPAATRRILAERNMTVHEAYSKTAKDAKSLVNASEVVMRALPCKDERLDTGEIRISSRRLLRSTERDSCSELEQESVMEGVFGHVSIRNVLSDEDRHANSTLSPVSSDLELYSVKMGGDFSDQLYKVKKHKELKTSLPALRERLADGDSAIVTHLDIRASNPEAGFCILLDDVLFGPFSRIRIKPTRTRSDKLLQVPIATFLPVNP